jgi:hypothetical protein
MSAAAMTFVRMLVGKLMHMCDNNNALQKNIRR